jgi:hypothetical protein
MRLPFAAPLFAGLCLTLATAPAVAAPSPFQSLPVSITIDAPTRALSQLATDADPRVLQLALDARQCAADSLGQAPSPRLAVIDYSRPSTEPRLWVFDLAANKLLFREVVAHGQGTGENMAQRFSNIDGTHQTSLGLFRTADTYIGHNGYSLRMQGLEPGTNDAAMSRAIVMHGAPYVNTAQAKAKGRLGRSWGCPAIRPEIARQVIDSLKNGQMIFSFYPDSGWLKRSPFIACKARRAQQQVLVARNDAPAGTFAGGGSKAAPK